MRNIFFHEDDYCQRELLPIDNFEFCRNQISEIEESSKMNFDGYGWNDLTIRRENPIKLSDLNINLEIIREFISEELPEYDKVMTGYSSYREECSNIFAFGLEDTDTLFVEVNEENILISIWCSHPMKELYTLPFAKEILYVDWSWGFVCPLSDPETINQYIMEYERNKETTNKNS
ncbi:hypothetical protein [Leptospira sarikeiensis]|uniref:Uncharacterized protein n=1 Tax=Leptospira sarikeiensis TaxID=2484943 RepID=A0A4R9K0V1_9LEPT|nr:hypothetical protein [Leptospira sarikeiensis]TGL58726.1 hypothetical protein EHQ64_16880 [Leptospira sarikeiensis]